MSGFFTKRLLVAAAAAASLLSACGNEATTATAPSPTALSPPPTAAPSLVVSSRRLPKLGAVLVDDGGFTLYLATNEKGGKIACTGTCAENWPPLVLPAGATRAAAGAGVRGSLLEIGRAHV